ncbi:hypothetical protein C5167_044799 [Papaver somniferum]|nr:hypothetical protein C5167_044799 [Papaver somniferum]
MKNRVKRKKSHQLTHKIPPTDLKKLKNPKQQTKGICGHCYQGLIWVWIWWLLLGEYFSGHE